MNRQIYSKQGRSRNVCYTAGSERKFIPVFQNNTYDLAESQRNDGKVISSKPEHGKTQQYSKNSAQGASYGKRYPEAESEVVIQQGVGISTHRVKGDISQVKKTRKAHDNVKAKPKHNIDQRRYHDSCLIH